MFQPSAPWVPSDAGVHCCPNCRSKPQYLRVVDQFKVDESERYRVRDVTGDRIPETFCNIFAADVADAMGVRLPRVWMGKELTANYMWFWLHEHGKDYGWEGPLSPHVAKAQLEQAVFSIAIWHNTKGPGHIAVLLPISTKSEEDFIVAQAGKRNYVRATLKQAFGTIQPELWSCR